MSTSTVATRAERRRRVFLAARTTFIGTNAQIRDRNAIIKVISQNERPFQEVITSFSKPIVYDITLSLLTNRVFESELKAKLAFPELFSVSAVRDLQHDASEQDAARSEQEALEEIVRSNDDIYGQHDGEDYQRSDIEDTEATEERSKPASFDLPSLFPSYLSYPVQHNLLNGVQSLLEGSCYEFAAQWVPAVLGERKWDCAEAVELSQWSKVLPSRIDKIATKATSLGSGQALCRVLVATHPLRHAAVHRLPTHGKAIEQMLKNALALVTALKDQPRMFKLEALLSDFQSKRQEMEFQKNNLENLLDEDLADIQAQRAALERREKEAKERMIRLDLENTKSVSSSFDLSIDKMWMGTITAYPKQEASNGDSQFEQPDTTIPSTLKREHNMDTDTQDTNIIKAAKACAAPDIEDNGNPITRKDSPTAKDSTTLTDRSGEDLKC